MKSRLVAIVSMFTFFLTAASCSLFAKRENKLIIASDSSYYPYEYLNQFSKLEGFDIDFAKMLADKMNKTLVIKTMPFDEQGKALNRGEIDILLNGMTITPEREKEFTLIPYHYAPVKNYYLAFWNKIPPYIKSIDEFKIDPEITIGVQKGTLKASYLTDQGIPYKTKQSTRHLFYDLKNGKTTALLLEPEEAHYIKYRHPEVQLMNIPLPKELWTDTMGIAVKKGNTQMADAVTKAIEELKADGSIQKLEEAWFQKREAPSQAAPD